ncbi:BrnT family toxin [Propionivibrio sp.]|uniref:BrnT family toxin n=1 Tax=Propionivibrio sp. TaxID=2212460 RepID=UPI0026262887|nr:BrnT family toxin [Propionivibrio sp.]
MVMELAPFSVTQWGLPFLKIRLPGAIAARCFPSQFIVDTINIVKIIYDPVKNAANIEQRSLPFALVAELDWSSAVIVEDRRKDYGERRFRVFGYIDGRLYAVVFTPREDAVHVISFRKANSREVKRHG